MNFVCPRCHGDLKKRSDHELFCEQDSLSFVQEDDVWRFLLPERKSHYAQFIKEYEIVRTQEGRYSNSSSYYQALPFKDLSGKFSADWKIRATSFNVLKKWILPAMQIVDLGAGNGWLSNRLTLLGAHVHAVDLLVNNKDGLGASKHYLTEFTPVQAEFDHLPFGKHFASLVIFNASFHYSEDYEKTLAESIRILQPEGQIIILDSPVYHHSASGEQMVAGRKMDFLSRYGFSSDSLNSENFLTYDRMKILGQKLQIHWTHINPFYGIRWKIRPWWARLRGKREPADFGLWVGRLLKPDL